MTYRMQITIDGTVYPVHRDVAHRHPEIVLRAMGVETELQLQRCLDTMHVSDWYDAGRHLGPDSNGLEMFDDALEQERDPVI